MLLLNASALICLSALLIPILLHLQRRRKAKEIAWAAMRFLTRSLAARRRGLMLENLLLLFCRCLLLVLFVLAMAQPVVGSYILRTIVTFVLGIGALLAIAYAVVTQSRISRIIAAAAAMLLLMATVWTSSTADRGLLAGRENMDLAIVIDGTMSMTVSENGKTHVENALAESQTLIDQLSGKSTVSIVLAGPVPQVLEDSPYRNLTRASTELAKLKPIGGGGNLSDAITRAKALLERGTNESKQLVVFSDNQLRTWQKAADGAESESQQMEQTVRLFGRLAKLPLELDNLAVVNVRIDTVLPTVQSSLAIEVEVLNGGTVTVHRRSLKLLIDQREVASQPIPQLEPGARTTLRFTRPITTAGHHTISGMIPETDLVMSDNRLDVVTTVSSQVSVLVIDGNSHVDLTEHSATFASLSLSPMSLRKEENAAAAKPQPILVERVNAHDIAQVEKLNRFQVIMMCETANLPDEATKRLTQFVQDGGGLWIIPGKHANPDFCNRWKKPDSDEQFVPGKMTKRQPLANASIGLDFSNVAQLALDKLVQRGEHDLGELSVVDYWKVEANTNATVAQRFTNGDVFMIEHTVGHGRVVLQSLSLNRRDSNLISLVTFPVLMHLWVQRLAASDLIDLNFRASPNLMVQWQTPDRPDAANEQVLKLTTPDGGTRGVKYSSQGSRQIADVGLAAVPGVYRIQHGEQTVPFTVQRDAGESEMASASAQKLKQFGDQLGIEWVDSVSDLRSASQREFSRPELWRWLIYATLCLLAIESLVARWVIRRRSQSNAESQQTVANPPSLIRGLSRSRSEVAS